MNKQCFIYMYDNNIMSFQWILYFLARWQHVIFRLESVNCSPWVKTYIGPENDKIDFR